MAVSGPFKVDCGELFPHGLGVISGVDSLDDFDRLVVVDLDGAGAKTGEMAKAVRTLGWKSALIVDAVVGEEFGRAVRNLPNVQAMPTVGANVHDILRFDVLAVTRQGVEALKERLS